MWMEVGVIDIGVWGVQEVNGVGDLVLVEEVEMWAMWKVHMTPSCQ